MKKSNLKTYTILKYRKGKIREIKGTLQELIIYFSYTLECGNAYNKKINKNPKTIKSLMLNLDNSILEKGEDVSLELVDI